jgi:hypothetical protein
MDQPLPATDSQTDLISSLIQTLSPARKQDMLGAAAQNRFVDLIRACQAKSVAEFIRALQADPHWPLLKELRLSDVVTTDEALIAPPAAEASSPSPSRHLSVVEVVEPAAAPGRKRHASKPAAAPKPAPAPRGKKRASGDIRDEILEAVAGEPGLRSEELQRRLGKPAVLVKATLAALRKNGELRTEGTRRATRYFLAGK